ncbi:hypothetical protein IL306_009182 [Fusarium sp. DS 682]|nr:hypothetical protein IL306_009182 [Fusarium sp. DS 682]
MKSTLQQKRHLYHAETSSRSPESPSPNDFRDPSLGPFSRDVNARAETIARAVSATQDPFRMDWQSAPAPLAPMGGDSVIDDTQEPSSEAGQDTTGEIVSRFRTAVRATAVTGQENQSHVPQNGTGNTTTDQPEKVGKSNTSAAASTTETPSNPAVNDNQSKVGQNLAKEMPPPASLPKTSPPREGQSTLMAKAESGNLAYDPEAARRFLAAHLCGYTKDTLTPIKFSFSVHHLGGHGDPFNISPVDFFSMTLKKFMDILPMDHKEMITRLCIRQYGPKFCLRQVYLYNEDVFGNIREHFLRRIESDTRDEKNHGKRLDYEISFEPLRDGV